MKIRATAKLLKVSGVKPVKDLVNPEDNLPGEWYASMVSLLKPGKFAVQFLHYPTYITILIPGKSLNKAVLQLQEKVSSFLKRNGYESLESRFELDDSIDIIATNSRSMLAHMNQIKYNLEYHFAIAESVDSIDYQKLEDIHLGYLVGVKDMKKKYIKPKDLLESLSKEVNGID
ncbi:MAG: hypothetical protein JEZ14_25185 [Marinilabiliaceae bacterium]|nr:hypothetical protein [Marinilabiliaceae bacterium]